MTASEPGSPKPAVPLSAKTMVLIAVVVLAATGLAIAGLLWLVNTSGLTGADLANARLDTIKLGLSIAVGGGGVVALFLAWRRQRSTEADHLQRERTLDLQRKVAEDTSHDALEQRITELYSKSAEQLGSDKAPVRLAAIYALERLAQTNTGQRQTVVNLLCSYLRMPPVNQEHEGHVRATALRTLTEHLREPDEERYWAGVKVDLSGATLSGANFDRCVVATAIFEGARFDGPATFALAEFETVSFQGAHFSAACRFSGSRAGRTARFDSATFGETATFDNSRLRSASFEDARFVGLASFVGARFEGHASFTRSTFDGSVFFRAVSFKGFTSLDFIHFADTVVFDDSVFHEGGGISRCVFDKRAIFTEVRFLSGRTFWSTVFHGDAMFGGSTFHGHFNFSNVLFGGSVNFANTEIQGKLDVFPSHARMDVQGADTRILPADWVLLEPDTDEEGELHGREGVWAKLYDRSMFEGATGSSGTPA